MLADLGFAIIVITFVLALYSAIIAILGERKKSPILVESARRAQLLTFPLLTLAAAILIYQLINNKFDVSFVYEVTSRSMPTYLKITAWWGGQAGSLLFWSWLLSAFTSIVTLRNWDRDREFLPWVIVVSSVTLAFFLSLNVFFENPFARFYQTIDGVSAYTFKPAGGVPIIPDEGQGLNPLLRHPGMIIHPPLLYLGYVSFVIPFAFAIAALVTGRTDDRWARITRRWTLWAWMFLSLGLVLGARWAYDVLGWGGYWGWDPVEIAAFMPWLTGTAFLHSVMIQEKRGMLKHWNMILIMLTYALVIFGTFLTRSGVLSSVHAFAQSAIGPMFFGFIGMTFIVSIALLIWRWPELKSETEMKSMFSRDAFFLFNNLLFLSVLVVSFWGVIFPLVSELFTGQKITVGPPFYERANAPIFGTMMALMGIAPLTAWGKSTALTLGRALWKPTIPALFIPVWAYLSGYTNWVALIGFFLVAFVISVTLYDTIRSAHARQRAHKEKFTTSLLRLASRNRRRYGGYLIHISMMLMAIGILGIELFQTETQGTISKGQSLQLGRYTINYNDVASWDVPEKGVNHTRAVVDIYKDNKYIGQLYPRIDYYFDSNQTMTIPALRSTLQDDLYILLVDWEPVSASGATFKIFHNPLVNWLWIGSLALIASMLFTAWPDKDPSLRPVRARKHAVQPGAAD
ncbi:MAG: heme lyase CcmF/NrfE family subunit [Anaerolineae bacterium]|nr:heme lyase CcmF/NrfE family subunit [Anaerolineae bacterium]MDK1081632.1 heme lyase CcmF/NrfE family subunit [Anaerolineae bacterium]